MAWCVTANASEPARQTGQLPPASAVEVEVRFFIGVEARPLHIEKQCLLLHCFTAATATLPRTSGYASFHSLDRVAQLVEQTTFNRQVPGSIPGPVTYQQRAV